MAHTLEADQANVRFGSLADICSAKRHVRFNPDSGRKSGHPANGKADIPQMVMSALSSNADFRARLRGLASFLPVDLREEIVFP